jgi:hypothetical protein
MLWEDAVTELEAYSLLIKEIKSTDLSSDKGLELLETFSGEPLEDFMTWAIVAEATDKISSPASDYQWRARLIRKDSSDQEAFKEGLSKLETKLQDILDNAGDTRFEYGGIPIWNPNRLSPALCKNMLEGIDYITALFDRNDMTELLRDGIKQVLLMPAETDSKIAGLYHSEKKQITIYSNVTTFNGRLLSKFVNEMFLHEFGHHIHLNLLDRNAKEYWDSTWSGVNEKKKEVDTLFRLISRGERDKFFELLMSHKWEPSDAAKKLGAIDKVKFGSWLRQPRMGDPLITPKNFRLTRSGKYLAQFYIYPVEWMWDNKEMLRTDPEYPKEIEYYDKRFKDKLGLISSGNYQVPAEAIAEIREANPKIDDAVKEEMAKLEPVTDYATTNELEDFAETFVAFMAAPEKLTKNSKERMQRTLSLSGLYGKPIKTLSNQLRRLAGISDIDGRLLNEVIAEFEKNLDEIYPSGTITILFKNKGKQLKIWIEVAEGEENRMTPAGVNKFKIYLDSREGKEELSSVLAHEVTHISQAYNGFFDYEFEEAYSAATQQKVEYRDYYNKKHDALGTEIEAGLVELLTYLKKGDIDRAVALAMSRGDTYHFTNREYLKKAIRFGVSPRVLAQFKSKVMGRQDIPQLLLDMLDNR